MLNKFLYSILFISFFLFSQDVEVAVVAKNKGDVQYKKDISKQLTNKINLGLELYNKDLLITGNDGFIMFAYLDDGSLIKVHKDSKVYVGGDLNNNIINKEVNVEDGFILFDIKKQKDNEFKVVTPSSVASVKGTLFILEVTEFGDIFYGFEGEVEVLNKEANRKISLQKSKKISSSLDGALDLENITTQDILYLQNIQEESGTDMYEIDQSEIESDTGSSDDESNIKELVIKLTNSLGEEKQLIIKFNE